MTDTTKMIAELEELRAKATPGEWSEGGLRHLLGFGYRTDGTWSNAVQQNEHMPVEKDATLIIAMHNYLPELIAGYKAATARAKKAEAARDWLAGKLAAFFQEYPELCQGDDYKKPEYWKARAEFHTQEEAKREESR